MAEWRPRRQSPRWLDGDCPREVLAIYDNGGMRTRSRYGSVDRYTIMYVPGKGQDWIDYFGCSPDPYDPRGVGIHGELSRSQAAQYRYRAAHQACKWTDLPPDVQKAVRDDCRGLAAFR